ncbi:MAG: hydrogenase maturation nickel metallochaperone HypA [Lachnospiraceae bacterium]|nr:hydrogenase maturation nickel metallochaperone HypA [Lachnospiraceae bacterium]
MHELGVVFHIVKSVKRIAKENNLSEIASVTVEVGEVSTVIPAYLTDCWKWAMNKEDALLHTAKLVVETLPGVTFCEDCKQTYGTVEFGKICPYCKSEHTYLLQGNEFNIKEIEAC